MEEDDVEDDVDEVEEEEEEGSLFPPPVSLAESIKLVSMKTSMSVLSRKDPRIQRHCNYADLSRRAAQRIYN